MRANASGITTTAASRIRSTYCAASDTALAAPPRRTGPAATPGDSGTAASPSPSAPPAAGATGTDSSTVGPASAGIVHPPVEDGEVRRRHRQGDEEQPDRVHGADADRVGPVEPVDLEHQRLGRVDRAALGQQVDLGEGLEAEDHQHHEQE